MAEKESRTIEQGDIFFFYRPKVGKEEVGELADVQRFYMVMSPESGKQRLFVLGQKQMPEIAEGRSTSEERNWALNVLTTSNTEDIKKELLPAQYERDKRKKDRRASDSCGRGQVFACQARQPHRACVRARAPGSAGTDAERV